MKPILVIILFLLIILVSCNKKKEYLSELSPDLLNCCYKTNSFWVYIDSVSNSTDSVYIDSYTQGYENGYETEYSITKKNILFIQQNLLQELQCTWHKVLK